MKMRKFFQHKLWRDKLIEIAENNRSIIHYTHLDTVQYNEQLRLKLQEEAIEVQNATSKSELIEEIADILEVVDALCALHEIDKNILKDVQINKRNERGGFYSRKLVTIAEHEEGSYGTLYCLAQPKKYPEIT